MTSDLLQLLQYIVMRMKKCTKVDHIIQQSKHLSSGQAKTWLGMPYCIPWLTITMLHIVDNIWCFGVSWKCHVPPLIDHRSLHAASVCIVHTEYGIVPPNWNKIQVWHIPIKQLTDSLLSPNLTIRFGPLMSCRIGPSTRQYQCR